MDIEKAIIANLDWLHRLADKLCNNREIAEDLVGDTIYKILRSKDNFDSGKSFKPWALTIMQNTYIVGYNRRKLLMISELGAAKEVLASDSSDSEVLFHEILSIMHKCSRESINIECVILFAKGYNYDEIAKITDVPVGTVKSRIYNGRKLILARLSE